MEMWKWIAPNKQKQGQNGSENQINDKKNR